MHTSSNDPVVIVVGTEKVLWAFRERSSIHLPWGFRKDLQRVGGLCWTYKGWIVFRLY